MAFAPYADLLWLETKSPNLEQARYFARKIREKYPGKYATRLLIAWNPSNILRQVVRV